MSADQNQTSDPGTTTFGLKKSETDLLVFTKTHQDAVFSALISTIAAERLAYRVTENTQFKLLDNMTKVEISERVPEGPPAETPAPQSPVKTAE